MRMAIRRGDVILKEASPYDYSTLEVKYILRTIKKAAPRKGTMRTLDDMATKAWHYADASFTIIRYLLCVVFGLAMLVIGVNIVGATGNFPIQTWDAGAVWFMILVIIGGILFVAAEVSTFVYLASIPRGSGIWLRNHANNSRYVFSLCMIGVVVSAVCLGCISGGKVVSCSLLIAFSVLSATFIAQAIMCGLKASK